MPHHFATFKSHPVFKSKGTCIPLYVQISKSMVVSLFNGDLMAIYVALCLLSIDILSVCAEAPCIFMP